MLCCISHSKLPVQDIGSLKAARLWNVTCFGFTCRFFTSTLFPHRTMGMFSHTLHGQRHALSGVQEVGQGRHARTFHIRRPHRHRSRCQVGTFL